MQLRNLLLLVLVILSTALWCLCGATDSRSRYLGARPSPLTAMPTLNFWLTRPGFKNISTIQLCA